RLALPTSSIVVVRDCALRIDSESTTGRSLICDPPSPPAIAPSFAPQIRDSKSSGRPAKAGRVQSKSAAPTVQNPTHFARRALRTSSSNPGTLPASVEKRPPDCEVLQTPLRRQHRPQQIPIDLHRHRPLQNLHVHHDTPKIVLPHQRPGQPAQTAVL